MASVIQRLCTGLQEFELMAQGLPGLDRGTFARAVEPVPGFREQGHYFVHLLGGATLQGIKCIVQRVYHRQQVNHAPAQFFGVAYGLRQSTFVGQLTDHQFQTVEGRHHG